MNGKLINATKGKFGLYFCREFSASGEHVSPFAMIGGDSNYFDTEDEAFQYLIENARKGEKWFVFEVKLAEEVE